MESTLRGLVEKDIDSLLVPEVLEKVIIWFRKSYPLRSAKDSLFGFIVGTMFGRFSTITALAEKRQPNDAELKEFLELIERRTLEIKSKIKLVLNKSIP
jgi:hypothetical protein